MGLVYLLVNQEPTTREISQSPITHGNNKAILILSQGKTIDLSPDHALPLLPEGIDLVLQGDKLIYVSDSTAEKEKQHYELITPRGGEFKITLPDGTFVHLNSNSKLRFPKNFAPDKREIFLSGEAYFEVTHNEDKPFVVQTNKCNVEVLGTKFNVEAYSDSEDFCTSLMEGSVRVSDKGNPSETVLLSPNHMVSLENGQLSTSPILDFDVFRWKEGLICFRNMNFEQLMLRFEKCYGVRIVVENKHLVNYICSGKFRISDGIDNALRILQKDAKYSFERNNDESVIYIK